MSSLDDVLAEAENPAYRRVKTIRILLRQDLLESKDALEDRIEEAIHTDARENRTPLAPQLASEMQELLAKVEDAKREFKFRSLDKSSFIDLLGAHPPLKDQIEAHKKQGVKLDHNPATFPPALTGLSWVDADNPNWVPDTKSEEFQPRVNHFTRLMSSLGPSQWDLLWMGCLDAQLGGLETPKSPAASMILRLSGRSATTPVPEESLAQSS